MTDEMKSLTHLGPDGEASMVDVAAKDVSARTAVAEGLLTCSDAAFSLLTEGGNPKGDVEQVARIAGIMAGKRTGELIPLCHLLPGTTIEIDLTPEASLPGVRATAVARVAGQTGVEMEALTAVSIALLTIYDMLKAVDRGMTIHGIRLMEKSGGRSGAWKRE